MPTTTIQKLQHRKDDALRMLGSKTNTRAIALRSQIEAIDLSKATRREVAQLEALCRKVEKYNDPDEPRKQFGRQPSFDSRLRAQNPRGSRGRHG